jgi:hypothetical protein
MSNTKTTKDILELGVNVDNIDSHSELYREYEILKKENNNLQHENNILKDIIVENRKETFQGSLIDTNPLSPINKYPKSDKSFYIQIFLGIFTIVLSLGFHILYLSVTSCLMYNEGNALCWIVNWLGINLHVSFYLDVILYSLIAVQIILVILLIRTKFDEKKI